MRAAFAIAMVSGALAAGFGYYLSFRLSVPTGAAMVGLAGLFYLATLAVRRK